MSLILTSRGSSDPLDARGISRYQVPGNAIVGGSASRYT
jgi:hypothetical protein